MIEPLGPDAGRPDAGGTIHRRVPRLVAIALILAVVAAVAGGAAGIAVARLFPGGQRTAGLGSQITITENSAVASAISAADPAVVEILSKGPGEAASGFLVSSDGYVVTDLGGVAGATSLRVLLAAGGRARQARLVDYDCQTGVAVLKVEQVSGLPTLGFASSSSLALGQLAVILGGYSGDPVASQGVVMSLHQVEALSNPSGQGSIEIADAFTTDAGQAPIQNGGPVVNANGQVIGIEVDPARGSAFALASDDVQADVAQIVAQGQLVVPGIGAAVQEVTALDVALGAGATGARITSVVAGGPAAKAGLQVGDVITAVDAQPLDDAHPLSQVLRTGYHPGQLATFSYLRDSASHQVQVTLDSEHPAC